DDLPREGLAKAIDRELGYLDHRPDAERIRLADSSCSVGELRRAFISLRAVARDPGGERLDGYVRDHFRLYRSTGAGGAHFTADYAPILEGRRRREGSFTYPLYRAPHDLVEASLADFSPRCPPDRVAGRLEHGRLLPYYSRAEIDGRHALAGHGLELFWLA